ncbi:F0F1 ATP synthase subunit B [Kitasatospora paracochleata]|uniref:ATP synthase subunit b n=1 Tax=Kitasatospora paracochleata TaxID=58354 RepID=A0ABT1IZM4_9ACTN|nr:hypothetical protein [Kitasatospora paracochleata]MCP2310593.1 F-type H+-transporting ATPase subunit b [Kitasatospora paracochleata]
MGPLQPNPAELVLGLCLFFALFAVLGVVLLPRIERVLADRHDATEGGLARAEQTRAEAERTADELAERLAAARHEAAAVRQRATEEAAALLAAARAEGIRLRAELVAEAHARIAVDRALAEIELRAEVGALSVELASRVVGEPLADFAAERGTVERYFADRPA